MDSKELYNNAYHLHYSQADYENALPIYKRVIKQYPDSKEAEYASKQIENINNMSAVEKQKNLENRIAIAKTKDKFKEPNMDSEELYDKARRLHYSDTYYDEALNLYKEIIEKYPDSIDAQYAKTQIETIEKMSADEKQKNKDKLIDIKDTHIPQIKNKEEGGFFSFRTMITPIIIKVLYVLGIIALIIVGIVIIVEGANSYYGSDNEVLIGLGIIILGNLLWRILCEGIILMFSIHERLGSIDKKID